MPETEEQGDNQEMQELDDDQELLPATSEVDDDQNLLPEKRDIGDVNLLEGFDDFSNMDYESPLPKYVLDDGIPKDAPDPSDLIDFDRQLLDTNVPSFEQQDDDDVWRQVVADIDNVEDDDEWQEEFLRSHRSYPKAAPTRAKKAPTPPGFEYWRAPAPSTKFKPMPYAKSKHAPKGQKPADFDPRQPPAVFKLMPDFPGKYPPKAKPKKPEASPKLWVMSEMQNPETHEEEVQVATTPLESDAAEFRSSFCVQERNLPQLFLLGAQKAATSSLAVDLLHAGVHTMGKHGEKEAHFFDRWANSTNLDIEDVPKLRRGFLQELPSCTTDENVVADFTPSNLRSVPLPEGTTPTGSHWGMWWNMQAPEDLTKATGIEMDLPTMIHRLYGHVLSRKLVFVVMLREPLSRMQSAWYHAAQPYSHWLQCRDCAAKSFQNALKTTLARAQGKLGGPPKVDDWLWASMYGRQLKHWLTLYDPVQFYVIAYKDYVRGSGQMVCNEIAEKMGRTLHCNKIAHGAAPASNVHEHPSLSEDCPNELYSIFMSVIHMENFRLFKVLAKAMRRGTTLANFNETQRNDKGVKLWLERGW